MSIFRVSVWALFGAVLIAPAGAQDQISVASAGAGAPFAVSALSEEEGGLPPELWRGSDLGGAVRAMSVVDDAGSSLAAAELAARVLSSGGQAPQAVGVAPLEQLLEPRLRGLSVLGRREAVDLIASRTVGGMERGVVARRAALARAAVNDVLGVCVADDALPASEAQDWWLRLRAVCLTLSGEAAAADTILELARDRGVDLVDVPFQTWLAVATGGSVEPPSGGVRDGVELLLARQAPARFEPALLENASPIALTGLAGDATAPSLPRLRAANAAAALGAISVETHRAALAAAAGEMTTNGAAALAEAQTAEAPVRSALIYRAVTTAESSLVQAEALAAAFSEAETTGVLTATARLYAPELAALPREEAEAAFGLAFIEAAAAAGETDVARGWLVALAGDGYGEVATGPVTLDLENPPPPASAPLAGSVLAPALASGFAAMIAATDAQAGPDDLADIAVRRLDAVAGANDADRAMAITDAALLTALGAEMSPQLRAALAGAAAASPALEPQARAAATAMELARDAGAQAETGLYAYALVNAAGLTDIAACARSIRALVAVGLGEDARAVAVEAMLAARRSG